MPDEITPTEIETNQNNSNEIILSTYTNALITTLSEIKKKKIIPEASHISVSQTVSFVAILYEKIRNAVEFRDEHLIRRAAIERILKRRILINPDGHGEGENLIRELLWARYLPNNSVTDDEVVTIQNIINKYLDLKRRVVHGRPNDTKVFINKFVNDLMTCEIEEELNPEATQKKSAFLFYFYQVLKNKVEIKEISETEKDAYFYIGSEIALNRSDTAYIRYHLFKLLHGPLFLLANHDYENISHKFPEIVDRIEKTINNPFSLRILKYIKKQVPPFLILWEVINRNQSDINEVLTNSALLWEKVEFICREKYQQTSQKLQRGAVRSVIYIFLTKTIFVIGLEFPLSRLIYGEVKMGPIITNTIFPPFLMGLLVSFVSIPSESNTKKIFERIVGILNKDPSFENSKALIAQKPRQKGRIMVFGFTLFYLLTFGVTFGLLYKILDYFSFNAISMAIFVFFISLITFFAYRIRQIAKEYALEEKESALTPVFDFFFIPFLSLGKFLSTEIAKYNIFAVFFDFLIEAPFKLIFNIIEEWINFVKARKEEIM